MREARTGPLSKDIHFVGLKLNLPRNGRNLADYFHAIRQEVLRRESSDPNWTWANAEIVKWAQFHKNFDGNESGVKNKALPEPKDGYTDVLLWSLLHSYAKARGFFESGPASYKSKPKRRNGDGDENGEDLRSEEFAD